ncbi:MAG: hypothetical protein Ct9H300mP16_01490 [Pseudomonadota bacterium]|nr:MAG: hypothetical protein Ct9H300mP16_01490 [Pseudomonadota bacterium]
MKTVQFDFFGPAHQVAYCAEVPDPGDRRDEVRVDVLAFPINPADLLTIEGKYAVKPPFPYTRGPRRSDKSSRPDRKLGI